MLRLFFLLLLSVPALAMTPPAIEYANLQLNDGSVHRVHLLGSRSHPYLALEDGRLLIEEGRTYYIAESDDGGLPQRTDEVFGQARGTEPPDDEIVVVPVGDDYASATTQSVAPLRVPYRYGGGSYDQPILIVRVAFADQEFEYSDAEIASRIFTGSDSVSAFFRENSYGQFRISAAAETSGTRNDGIVSITLSSNHPDFGSSYGSASMQLVKNAIAPLADYVNLSAYDRNGDLWLDPSELGIVVLVAGFEQAYASSASTHPRIWAHKSAVTATQVGGMWLSEYAMFGEQHEQHLATTGIIAHEFGHLLLDLPDLYDSIGIGSGIGRWGLMSYGTWNSAGGHAGDKPAHLVAWAKEFIGFSHAYDETSGAFSLSAASESDGFIRLDIDAYRHGKRVLIENRQQTGFDKGIPSSGVFITEVDDWFGFGPLASLSSKHSDLLIGLASTSDGSGVNVSGGTLVTSAQSIRLASGQIVLSNVQGNGQASLSIANSVTLKGRAVGYDDVPPNGTWGNYGDTGQVVVDLDVSPYLKSIDGVDFFAHGSGTLELAFYEGFSRYSGEKRLASQTFSVTPGWNRLLLSSPAEIGVDRVYMQMISTPSGSHAPFVVDVQGTASGRTQARLSSEAPFSDVDFDVSARMLIATSEVAVERAPATTSSKKTSGGGAFVWGLLLVFLLRKRLY
ncbi:M6 family metalloprotease domain-containing protein [uncultured Thalassolituus sp.]|uniref:M6 family metalloprotease domain-containing protein n=1 Tax=uncultured Thalassolituus sp. TaxID=285273 RepID=UPI0026318361|nr:M6 family metalloprotease domain-containing protein [uncultured Thalassolituus sp.]